MNRKIPWLDSPARFPGSIPRLDSPARFPGSIPRLDSPARFPGSIPRLDSPARFPGSIPRLDSPARFPGSIPRLDSMKRAGQLPAQSRFPLLQHLSEQRQHLVDPQQHYGSLALLEVPFRDQPRVQ